MYFRTPATKLTVELLPIRGVLWATICVEKVSTAAHLIIIEELVEV